jgi:hypothetical protein
MTTASPPCRLYFILAREAPVGVIFRRGPTRWVQLIKWNTDSDTFEPGQWFHGRIRETRSDLSPSGDKLIYAAYSYRKSRHDPHIGYAWTTISRPPYLTAIALWPTMSAACGGGQFDTEDSVRIWYPFDDLEAHSRFPVPDNFNWTQQWLGSCTDEAEQGARMDRDGWRLLQSWNGEYIASALEEAALKRIRSGQPFDLEEARELGRLPGRSRFVTHADEVRERSSPGGEPALVMRWAIAGFRDKTRFSVKYASPPAEHPLDRVTWADWDQSGRLVMVADGKLFAGEIGPHGVDRRELADFNRNKFEAIEAPDWAKQW